jgi:hypothetical protein
VYYASDKIHVFHVEAITANQNIDTFVFKSIVGFEHSLFQSYIGMEIPAIHSGH